MFLYSGTLNSLFSQTEFYHNFHDNKVVKEFGEKHNNNPEGLWLTFDKSGQVRNILFYSKGKAVKTNRVFKEYFYKDKIKAIGIKKDDKKEGLWVNFRENGTLETSGFLIKGKKQGEFIQYHYGGAIHVKNVYENDKLVDGEYIFYHPNGKKKIIANYLNGNLVDSHKTYYESGAIEIDGLYNDNGLEDGTWKEYYENGKLKEQYTYKNGSWHGDYITYDEDGNILSKAKYENDVLVSKN